MPAARTLTFVATLALSVGGLAPVAGAAMAPAQGDQPSYCAGRVVTTPGFDSLQASGTC